VPFYSVVLFYGVVLSYNVDDAPLLQVSGMAKTYGEHAVLRGIDLEVASGQILGLVGANGAGKTTLISIVTGLLHCDRGSVAVAGIDALAHPKRAARCLGLAPQELGIYPTLTVRENLYDFARLAGLDGRAARARTLEAAELLGLTDQLGLRGDQLSGGQKRRLHTAMAILHRPQLLLLDEPTVGADVTSRAGILEIVRAMATEGTAVLYTTHYLTELEQLDAEIAVLDGGVIAVHGSCREVVRRWGRASVALRFTGPAPELEGWTADGSRLTPTHPVTDPGATAAAALVALGPQVTHLVGLDVTRPSLESAYLAITGHVFSEEAGSDLAA
jgi:ABC-2 type transport system ATP-binding protein